MNESEQDALLRRLTREDFENLTGEEFVIDFGDAGELGVRLASVTAREGTAGTREPFSIEFHCEHPVPAEQGTYEISHAALGELQVFLVPVSADENNVVFEAVFT